jgi:hypothetical protein
LGNNLAYLGYFDQARSRAKEGEVEARRHQHNYAVAFGLLFRCRVAWLANSDDEVRRHADDLFDLANEHGFPQLQGYSMIWRGRCAAAAGQASDGFAELIKGLSILRATGATIGTAYRTPP